jgi:hypothetical protein
VTLSAVDVNQAGEASGVNNTSRQIGSTLGSAIIGAIFLTTLTSSLISGINKSKVIPDTAKEFVKENVVSNSSELEFGGQKKSNEPVTPISKEILSLVHEATVDGGKKTLLYTAGFSLLTLLVSLNLPNVHMNRGKKEDVAYVSGH